MSVVSFRRLQVLILLLLLRALPAQSQCSIGQTPSSAFPICGTDTLHMDSVPPCTGRTIPVPGCSASTGYSDLNAFWYKFTCYSSGTLAFTITPKDMGDDYDWQLFDITGHNADDVYTDPSLVVTGNWAGTFGLTGASDTGVPHIECASSPPDNKPTFSSTPNLIVGHNYLLMISHYTITNQSGYDLSFTGGTASITDPNMPHLGQAVYDCPTKTIRVKLNKEVKCASLVLNASDFMLTGPGPVNLVSAAGVNCDSGFDLDSLVLKADRQLPPGNYTLTIRNGSDGNTLLDYCNRDIPPGEQVSFSIPPPALVYIDSLSPLPCAPDSIQIIFTLPLDCATIAPDGSDFTITGPSAVRVISAKAPCLSNNADNTITLYLDKRIIVGGTYRINIVTGSDGNSVATECGQYILAGDNNISFFLAQQPASVLKKIEPITCRAQSIRLILTQPVQCSSIARDGSDFSVTGPTPVTITRAHFTCAGNVADTIELFFSQPIYRQGVYTIRVKSGTDGNTLLTDCWQPTPAGNSSAFLTQDTVSAGFTYQLFLHCEYDTVALQHDGAHNVSQWKWYFDGTDSSDKQNPIKVYTRFGTKQISLIVSNGVCSDTSSQQIVLSNVLKASFDIQSDTLCPSDPAVFVNTSIGNIIGVQWDFANGYTSRQQNPPTQQYAIPMTREKLYHIRLIVQSDMNCYDTAIHSLHVLNSCYIAVPTAFTPNGDGLNDYLYPLNGFKTAELDFQVYNRLGQMVFHTKDYTKKWDGRFNGEDQPTGTYVWMLSYIERESGKRIFLKGTSVLIR